MFRKRFFLPVFMVAVAFLPLSACCASGARFTAVGGAVRIDLDRQAFDLVSDEGVFTVLASRAEVRLEDGRSGRIREVREGALVRIFGERLSERTVRADTIVVLENDAQRTHVPPRRYRPDERIEIDGVVRIVRPDAGEIEIRAGDVDYVVVIGPRTVVRRYLYVTDVSEIRSGDRVGVFGTVRGSRISALRIQLIEPGGEFRPLYADRREDVVEGEIVVPTSSFDRTLLLATEFGERKVDVRRGAQVTRDGQSISVHDLRRGERVRVCGVWNGDSLSAVSIEVIDDTSAGPVKEPETQESPTDISGPGETIPSETPGPTDSPEPAERTGRIVSIDPENRRLTVDTGLADVPVDAAHAEISREGTPVAFADLKKGDRVTVVGELREGVLHARSVEVSE